MANILSDDHADLLYRRQNGVCAVTGLPFSLQMFPEVLVKHPFAPSLDRVVSSRGYEPDNVRLVCIAVNFGMGEWGQELYLTFARAAVEYDRIGGLASTINLDNTAVAVPTAELPSEQLPTDDWKERQRDRIHAAEAVAMTLTGNNLRKQVRHLAALRRALSLGPEGLAIAARKAQDTKRVNNRT